MRAHKKGLELIYHVQPDVPDALIGDAGRLGQVLLNLAGNAVKFTDEGEVVMHVETDQRDTPPPSGEATEVVLRFTVRDTGIGIPTDQQERIFRAFEQEDISTTRKYGGTGLGLTIAARLVALMGGMIRVVSGRGQGSTFIFTARFGRQPLQPEPMLAQWSDPAARGSKSCPCWWSMTVPPTGTSSPSGCKIGRCSPRRWPTGWLPWTPFGTAWPMAGRTRWCSWTPACPARMASQWLL